MNVWVGSDHAGLALKTHIKKLLQHVQWKDVGCTTADRCDYPDFAAKVAEGVRADGYANLGVLICGSGIGMSIAANRYKGIRAAHVTNPVEARLAREHNNAHIICLGARFLAAEYAAELIQIFLTTDFSRLSAASSAEPHRHQVRIDKIETLGP